MNLKHYLGFAVFEFNSFKQYYKQGVCSSFLLVSYLLQEPMIKQMYSKEDKCSLQIIIIFNYC
jgi:hypothetical protein